MDKLAYRHYHMYARINLHQVPRLEYDRHWMLTRCAIDNNIPLEQLVPDPQLREKLNYDPCTLELRSLVASRSSSSDCICGIVRRRLVYILFQKAICQ